MKKIIYLFCANALIMLGSCNSTTSNYEKMIGEFVQTHGNEKIDLKFKPLDTKEIKIILVADSLNWYKNHLDNLEAKQELSQEIKQSFHKGKLNDTVPYYQIISDFQKRDTNEVIGKIVECKWQGTLFGNIFTETDYFLFSPDGKRIIKKVPPPTNM